MSKKFLISIFLVSVVFNLAFIGTFFFLHFVRMERGPVPPEFQGHMPMGIREKFYHNREALEPLRNDFMDSKRDFTQSLWSKDFNRDISLEKLDETLKKQIIMEQKLGIFLIELRENMTDEEIRKLFLRKNRLKNFRKNRFRRK